MSDTEYEPQGERRSSVSISENSKGDPAITVKVYTHDLDTLAAARQKAVETYKQTVADVRGTVTR